MCENRLKWLQLFDNLDALKRILPVVNPAEANNFAITWASSNGYLEMVRLLLKDSRVDPTIYSNRAIRWASEGGYTEVVKLLMTDSRVDSSDLENDAINLASENGYIETVKVLLTDSRVVEKYLNVAIIKARTDEIKVLLHQAQYTPIVGNKYKEIQTKLK